MLELKNVSAGYGAGYGAHTVLEGASVSFEKGRLTAIIGRNGCGKTTLLKTALGLLATSSGEVLIDGENIAGLSRNAIAQKVSYLPQGRNVPDMTVGQLVIHGRFPYLNYPRRYTSTDKQIAAEALEKIGISHLVDKPLGTLSGGMRQSAYLAMALAQDTDYILLDEPTTYLDISNQLDLMRNLRKLAENGKGIIAVMHDLPLAFNYSDSIVVLDDSGIRAHASPAELATSATSADPGRPDRRNIIADIFSVSIRRIEGRYVYWDL